MNDSENPHNHKGFELFKTNMVRRISSTHFLVKPQEGSGSFLIELKDGRWICDCNPELLECEHRYAARLAIASAKFQDEEPGDLNLKCRYCSSIDVSRCGFRYNSRGIMRRYVCHDCLRKFSIPYVQNQVTGIPTELAWLLNEVGMLASRMTQLLSDLGEKVETISTAKEKI